MSENQKVLVSMVAAVAAHMLLLVGIAAFLALASVYGPQKAEAAVVPEEVTIMLEDLISEEEEEKQPTYIRTSPDQQAKRAPEKARFESDRDTLAASKLAARPDDPKAMEVPTLHGEREREVLEMKKRKFVDGEFEEKSLSSQPVVPMSVRGSMRKFEPTPQKMEPPVDSKEKLKPDKAEKLTRRPVWELAELSQVQKSQQSFVDPNLDDSGMQVGKQVDEEDQVAKRDKEVEKKGEPEDKPRVMISKPISAMTSEAQAQAAQAASADIPPTPKPPSEKPSFTPETDLSKVSGTISNRGKAALDVKASELGKYKKKVTQAVERKWHRYRQDHADYATYGSLKIKFKVSERGDVFAIKISRNNSNTVMTDFTLRSIIDADIPPMPRKIKELLRGKPLEITYSVIIY